MATFFDEVKAIVLDRGTKASKIDRLCKDLKCTVYQANTYYNQVRSVEAFRGTILTTAKPRGQRRFTMGVEIECFGIDRQLLKSAIERRGLKAHITGYNHVDSADSYKLGSDGSICGGNSCEIVSPVLKSLDSLKTVCEVINEAGAQVNRTCGLHVHLGAEKFTPEQWRRIVLNYAAIERIIDSFMAPSRRNNRYCQGLSSVARGLSEPVSSISEIQDTFGRDRYYKVNVMAYNSHRTIEFRQHQGTTEYEKISNWIGFLTSFVSYSLTHDEIMSATTIDDLPFLSRSLKDYYKGRKEQFERR